MCWTRAGPGFYHFVTRRLGGYVKSSIGWRRTNPLHTQPRARVCAVAEAALFLSGDGAPALRAIAADLKDIKSAVSAMGHRAVLPSAKSGDEIKLVVAGNGIQVKVEVNFVLRRTVLPVVQLSLVSNSARTS